MEFTSEMVGVFVFLLLFAQIALHVPIGVAIGVSGLVGVGILVNWNAAFNLLATEPATTFSNAELIILPLFVLMGAFSGAAGMSADLFRLLFALVGHRPGGLAYSTIGACAGFGAVCGSSIATTATMTKVALPEMTRRGYSQSLSVGSIAAGGTLGMLIPPSIVMVVYGFLTDQFVLTLFAAALIPGLIAVLFHFGAIYFMVLRNPDIAPAGERLPMSERLREAGKSWAVVMLVVIVAGGIYSGIFTVNESASVGVLFTFLIWGVRRKWNFESLKEVIIETGINTAVLYLVIIGASIFTFALTLSGIPETLVGAIGNSGFPPIVIIFLILFMYLILGAIFETISAMVITLPFVFPLILELGYDPIWWGIVNVMVIEIGMITPPIGLNVFVLHRMAPEVPLSNIFRGTGPFVVADLLRLILLTLVPGLTLYLPSLLGLN